MIQKTGRILFWVILALILFWTLSPVQLRPQFGHAALERAAAFIALGGALGAGYPRRLILVAIVVCLIAIGSEALQLFIATRHARVVDAAEKVAGGLAGVLTAAAAWRIWRAS